MIESYPYSAALRAKQFILRMLGGSSMKTVVRTKPYLAPNEPPDPKEFPRPDPRSASLIAGGVLEPDTDWTQEPPEPLTPGQEEDLKVVAEASNADPGPRDEPPELVATPEQHR
jgi:hypothetical protein